MTTRSLWVAAIALSTLSAVAPAQAGPGGRAMPPQPPQGGRARLAAPRQAPPPRAVSPERQAQLRQIRLAFDGVVKRELKLDDQKMRQLRQARNKFDQQRRELNLSEADARLALKTAMEDSTGRDQTKIAAGLDELVAAKRRAADLLESEQKELSTFLTPLQRAQYLSLQERLARRVAQVRNAPPGAVVDTTPPDR